MYKITLLTFSVFICLTSCKPKIEVKCFDERYNLVTVGYKFYDIDTLIIKWYKPETGFTELIEESSLALDPRDLVPRNDTIFVESFHVSKPQMPGTLPFTYEYDVEITIPANQQRYRIGNIESDGRKVVKMRREPGAECKNGLISYELDSTRHICNTNADKDIYLAR